MKTSKEKQDQRKAELQAAALRDGFETWSQALTAWKNGKARLTTACTGLAGFSASPSESTLEGFTGQVGLSQPTANQ